MKKIILVLTSATLFIVATAGCIELPDDKPDWIWTFEADQWYEVTFTQEMFTCAESDAPEDIFHEATSDMEFCIYQQIEGEWLSWWSNHDPVYNTLYHITPGVVCNIHSDTDFTLVIEGC